jgi:SOS response regulatory protein OraA/RecX
MDIDDALERARHLLRRQRDGLRRQLREHGVDADALERVLAEAHRLHDQDLARLEPELRASCPDGVDAVDLVNERGERL